jgi:hypothetical protein
MSLPVVFHPDVQGEIDKAYRWYEQQRAGLGDDFLAESSTAGAIRGNGSRESDLLAFHGGIT